MTPSRSPVKTVVSNRVKSNNQGRHHVWREGLLEMAGKRPHCCIKCGLTRDELRQRNMTGPCDETDPMSRLSLVRSLARAPINPDNASRFVDDLLILWAEDTRNGASTRVPLPDSRLWSPGDRQATTRTHPGNMHPVIPPRQPKIVAPMVCVNAIPGSIYSCHAAMSTPCFLQTAMKCLYLPYPVSIMIFILHGQPRHRRASSLSHRAVITATQGVLS